MTYLVEIFAILGGLLCLYECVVALRKLVREWRRIYVLAGAGGTIMGAMVAVTFSLLALLNAWVCGQRSLGSSRSPFGLRF